MNTVCTINLFEDGNDELYAALSERLFELEKIFDVNNPDSEISKVNSSAGSGEEISVSRDFSNVISTALIAAKFTDGAFNPLCGALVKLWGINTDNAKVPPVEEIESAIKLCDFNHVNFLPNQSGGGEVELTKTGMSLDFGGIVKGYAADELVSILRKNNVRRAILDLGGNIYVFGQKKDGSLWKVGVKDPDNLSGNPKFVLECEETSIVTSGNYERFFEENGKRYHHILDCKTGFPAENGISSVTIECKSSLWADVLSTALFVMGSDRIKQTDFPEFAPPFKYTIIFSDGTVIQK